MFSFAFVATIQSHLLSVDVAVLDEGGAADVDGDVLRGLPVLDEALLHVVLLTLLLLQQKKHQIKPISQNPGMYLEKNWMKYEMSPFPPCSGSEKFHHNHVSQDFL